MSCSIVRTHKDKAGTTVKKPKARKRGGEQYIDELSLRERDALAGRKIVGIDPNMGNLLYCVGSDQQDQTKFRW